MSNSDNNTSLDFLDISSGIVVNELEVPQIESKKKAKKATKSIKFTTVVSENIKNSLSTFKERIASFTKEQQVVLLKEWESKRNANKVKHNKTIKELENSLNKLKVTVIEIFPILFKSIGKSHTLVIRSKIDERSYRFKFSLRKY